MRNMIKSFLVVLSGAAMLLAGSDTVHAAVVASTPNISFTTSGAIHEILVEPSGHIIIAGRFDSVGGLPRKNLARLHPDGSVDSTWVLDTNGEVYDLEQASAGSIYIAGGFTDIDGFARPGLARASLSAGDPQVGEWIPQGFYYASNVELAADGDVFVTDFHGVVHRFAHEAEIPDAGWGASGSSVSAYDIDVSSDGQFIATCAISGELALRTRSGSVVWRKQWDGGCILVGFAPDGDVRAARHVFVNDAGLRRRILMISSVTPQGEFDARWDRVIDQQPTAMTFNTSGETLVAIAEYRLTNRNIVSAQASTVLFAADGTPISTSSVIADSEIRVLRSSSDGKVLAAGPFRNIGHRFKDGIAYLSGDLTAADNWSAEVLAATSAVNSTLRLHDGSYLISGNFSRINGQVRQRLAHFSSEFELMEDSWPLQNSPMWMAQDEDGDCYLGGFFPMSFQASATVTRLGDCSAVDTTWMPDVEGSINSIALGREGDHGIYLSTCDVITNYTSDACEVRRYPTDETGLVEQNWHLPVMGGNNALLYHRGALFLGGHKQPLWPYSGQSIVKVNDPVAGMLDSGWMPSNSPSTTYALLSQGGQEIIAVGAPRQFSSSPPMIRLDDSSGAENVLWQPWRGLSAPYIQAFDVAALLPDNRLYFSSAGAPSTLYRTNASGRADHIDADWRVEVNGRIDTIISGGAGELIVSGLIFDVAGQPRRGIARLLDVHPTIFVDHFE